MQSKAEPLCRANQLTGFYIITTLAFKELKNIGVSVREIMQRRVLNPIKHLVKG